MPRRREPPRLWLRRDEGVWIILDGGNQIRTGCSTDEREQAEAALLKYLNAKSQIATKRIDPSKITLGEILARYADDIGPTHKDPARTAFAIDALAPFWGDCTPDDISIAKTREYEVLRQRHPGTVRRELGVLQAALNHAAIALGLPNLPKIRLPQKTAPRDRWLTKEEVNRLLQHSPPHLQRFIKISLCTGRRKRTVLDLRWSQSADFGWIDLNQKVIVFKGTNQTESSKRRGSIAIPDSLLDLAVEWQQDGNPSVIHFEGKPLKDIKSSFKRACADAGLKDVTPHTLKHTAVTWAFQSGMSVEDASDYFATSIDTLLGVYRQHSPQHQQRAASIMSQIGDGFIADIVA